MRNLIALVSISAACLIGGCRSDDGHSHKGTHAKQSPTQAQQQTVAKDMCTHCPGLQTATADGKCPSCGMVMSKSH
jgi:rubrerythrin